MEKRTFLKMFVAGVGGVTGLATLVPGIATALSPALQRGHGPRWRPVGPLNSFEPNAITRATVHPAQQAWGDWALRKGVYVSRIGEREVVVFSRSCTDLSCPVEWDARAGCFFCPCHGGIFSRDGERMAGPPRRPLYRFATRVQEGVVEIDLNSVPPIA